MYACCRYIYIYIHVCIRVDFVLYFLVFSYFSNPDEVVRAKVPFSSCLSKYSLPADIPDFYSSAVQAKSPATR